MDHNGSPILSVRNLKKTFQVKRGYFFAKKIGVIKAVNDISFDVEKGATMGLVGESGCGKTTAGRMIARLIEADSGEVLFEGKDILKADPGELSELRRKIQFIFQDPLSSLNPRMSVFESVAEPLEIQGQKGTKLKEEVTEAILEAGLNESFLNRYPHQLSGGQRQRVIIARALSLKPSFVVADEPVSALDVSVQAQILALFTKLRDKRGFSALFVSHDLAVVRTICQQVAVMYMGFIVETGPADKIFESPLHPYTLGLIESAPHVGEKFKGHIIPGEMPDPLNPPPGCPFNPRCRKAEEICRTKRPSLEEKSPGRKAACHFPES